MLFRLIVAAACSDILSRPGADLSWPGKQEAVAIADRANGMATSTIITCLAHTLATVEGWGRGARWYGIRTDMELLRKGSFRAERAHARHFTRFLSGRRPVDISDEQKANLSRSCAMMQGFVAATPATRPSAAVPEYAEMIAANLF